jgi:hypothetical protein
MTNQLKRLFVCEYDKRKLMYNELESMEVEVTVSCFQLSSGSRVTGFTQLYAVKTASTHKKVNTSSLLWEQNQ